MPNKKLDLLIGLLFIAALVLGISAQAATTGTVTATVTVQNVSVVVTSGTIVFGTLSTSAASNTVSSSQAQYARNNGNVTETLSIKGSTSTPGSWTLSNSIGASIYTHEFSTSTVTNWLFMTVNYATITTTIPATGTSTLYFRLTAPSSVSDYTVQNVDVTVLAAAT